MSAAVAPSAWERPRTGLRGLLAGPAEGWASLAGVVVMIVALGWSIDDARWVNGADKLTDFLPLPGLAGIAIGFLGPKLGWGRWTTHLLGVAFAAIVLPIVAGGIVLGDSVTGFGPAALAARFHEAADIATRVWIDLGVRGKPFTSEYGHYFIALGAVMWATGQFAAYAVFGHRRTLDAVIVTGLVLLGNMALTRNDQLQLIVLFSLAALALLARSHAFDERTTWLRRRIGDPGTVTGLYLRGGAVFICAAVVGSLFLTATASSAPLQGLWKNLPATLVTVSEWVQKFLPGGGTSRDPGVVAFGPDTNILTSWTQSDGVAFTAQLPATETERFRWRVGAYEQFDGNSWSWGTTTSFGVPARDDILAGTGDDPVGLTGRREVPAQITPASLVSGYVVSPQTIEWVDQASRLKVIGSQSWFATVQIDGVPRYAVTALVPVIGSGPDQINANRLRVASRDYSPDIQRQYLVDPGKWIGPAAQQILDDVLAETPDKNPYDLALNMQNYLLDNSRFHYQADVSDLVAANCSGLSTVECFARIRAGYCQYYATTMAILLRKAGIPTRLAQGFLPGDRNAAGTETVRNAGAHAWVEVYFPGYGWSDFDPTGGNVGQPTVLPSGPPASPTPRPTLTLVTDRPGDSVRDPRRTPGNGVPGAVGGSGGTSPGPFIVIAILVAIGAAALASIAWRRGPRPMHPDRAWSSLARWATRFGVGPRPSQTVYEFAGALGDALPVVRPELTTVANAKVEIAYGHRELGTERLKSVADAHRRLRLGLLRLLFRRPRRRRRGPGTIGRR
ncbi:MAG: transglutaminase domain-containing protein, partial [Chloroflexi bacterium]|nr:transglutaminase domain-containing protein [Chloroflexota bacterium]